MAEIECMVEEVEVENEESRLVPGVMATCSECDHSVESYGTGGASVRRCLAVMRDECPRGENNFYVEEE